MKNVAIAAALAIGTIALVAQPKSADACSCVMAELPDKLQGADIVFVGTAIERLAVKTEGGPLAGPVEFRFSVDRTFKGELGETVDIRTAASSAACGANFEMKKDYVVFASKREDVIGTSLCSGNQLSTPELIAQIEAELGGSTQPPPDDPPPDDPTPTPPTTPPPATKGNPACGGCASSGQSESLAALLLIGLLARPRRRRK